MGEYGWQAVTDGGGQQLLEHPLTVYLSTAAYTLFKPMDILVHGCWQPPRVQNLSP
ncbi:MAG: hypothetical protein V4805_06710 [Pseudomonadota bacterium]